MTNKIFNTLPYVILALAIGFNLYFLWPELRILADLNDNVFAFGLINRANDIVKNCSLINPDCFIKLLDHWVSYWAVGYPLPHYYQHWPSILVVVLFRVFTPLTHISLFEVFNVVKYLLYASFPLAIYYSARKFDFPPLAAAFSAFLANLISTNYQYGTDYGAVIWRGSGMHTQLWGMVALPLAVSTIYAALKNSQLSLNNPNPPKIPNLLVPPKPIGKGGSNLIILIRPLVLPILTLTFAFHAHLLFGYIAVLSGFFLPFIFALEKTIKTYSKISKDILIPLTRTYFSWVAKYLVHLLTIYSLAFILLAYWIIPLVLNNDLHAHSVWDDYWKFNSFGAREVIQRWVTGEIFDYNRFPVMTILIVIGFFTSLLSYLSNLRNLGNLKPKTEKFSITCPSEADWRRGINFQLSINCLFLSLMLVFWTLMYFGRNTWGGLIDLLPMAEGIHMHRFINGIHFVGIFLSGLGLYWILSQVLRIKIILEEKAKQFLDKPPSIPNYPFIIAGLLILILILTPIIRERVDFLNHNTYLIKYGNDAFTLDMKDFQPVLDRLQTLTTQKPGRIYAGRPGNWGRDFKVGMVSVFLTMSVRGYDTLGFEPESWSPNTDMEQFFDENRLDHYNLFNIRYLIAPAPRSPAKQDEVGPISYTPPTFAKKELASGKYALYTVETNGNFEAISVPYLLKTDKEAVLNFVHSWLWSKMPQKANHMIITYKRPPTHNSEIDKIPPSQIVTLNSLDWSNYQTDNKDYNLLSYNPFEATPSSVAKVKFSNEKVTLDSFSVTVETPQDTLIMLKATYHPYWQVTIDGKPTAKGQKIAKFMVSPAFMAVGVPKGTHEVSFTYQTAGYKKVLILGSFLTFIGLVVTAVVLRRKEDKN